MSPPNLFSTKSGFQFPGITLAELLALRDELRESYGILDSQIAEAASYSLAMVVRFALGLSAQRGQVCVLVKDSLCGWIALAALRHLVNGGASGRIITVGEELGDSSFEKASADLRLQAKPLLKMGVEVIPWKSADQNQSMSALFQESHNVICGMYVPNGETTPLDTQIMRTLNDLRTPIHTVESPLGLNADTGMKTGEALFASSTLSLGAPLSGLYKGNDYAGRHYVCDISLPRELYTKNGGPDLGQLFDEQPVVQISPVTPDAET